MFTYLLMNKIIILIIFLFIYSLCKIDDRCLFLYVHANSDDFQMYFPSSQYRQRFYDLVKKMTEGEEGMMTNLDEDSTEEQINVDFRFLLLIINTTLIL